MIKVSQVSKTYPNGVRALQDISFEIASGQVVYLLGESGSGKSTLVKLIGGLEDTNNGSISVDDEKITGPAQNLVPGYESIAYVSQDFKLQPYWSVEDNISKKISFLTETEKHERVLEWLKLFQIASFAERMPGELSGGEQQRIAIAAAVIDLPPVILLDEPFSNLDLPMKAAMRREMIEKLRQHGVTVILISHDPSEAMAVADQIMLLRKGKIVQMATPEKLYHQPNSYYAASFLGPVNEMVIGGKLKLVRPENMIIGPNGDFTGEVLSSSFAGAHYHCEILIADQSKPALIYSKTRLRKHTIINFIVREY